jgi:hypothetical protein
MAYQKPVPEKFYKQPWETYLVGADFSKVLEIGEALVVGDCDILAVDSDDVDRASVVLDNSYKVVSTADADDINVTPITNGMLMTRVKAGVDLMKYKLTFHASSDSDNQFETDVFMEIKDA